MNRRIYLYPGQGQNAPHYFDSAGTIQDLAESGIKLSDGLRLEFYDFDENEKGQQDKLLFEGTVHYDCDRQKWYAVIDWSSFTHESKLQSSG